MTSSFSKGIYPIFYAFFDDAGYLKMDAFRRRIGAVFTCDAAGVAALSIGTEVEKLNDEERVAGCLRISWIHAK